MVNPARLSRCILASADEPICPSVSLLAGCMDRLSPSQMPPSQGEGVKLDPKDGFQGATVGNDGAVFTNFILDFMVIAQVR